MDRKAAPPSSPANKLRETSTKACAAASADSRNSSTSASASATLPATAVGSEWKSSEIIALYAVQSKTDLTLPDFWAQVSSQLSDRGVFRSEEECRDRWFAVRYTYVFLFFHIYGSHSH